MKFLIISPVTHKQFEQQFWGYGPYIREMNLWEAYVDQLIVVAPLTKDEPNRMELPYTSSNIQFLAVPEFSLVGWKNMLKAIIKVPLIFLTVFKAMYRADHIHLRCPSNMGLIGAIAQIFFPNKIKTAKYAGNWDPFSQQPWSYRLQKYLLNHPYLTHNMQALVYGDWPNSSRNIHSFFTASYRQSDRLECIKSPIGRGVNLIFVGTLTQNKRPQIALEVLNVLRKQGVEAYLNFCGDGPELESLKRFATRHELQDFVDFKGLVNAEDIKKYLQEAHFLIFASQSEGWPKAVAEAMWWGTIPMTTAVSCVPQMLGNGSRGVLVNPDPEEIAAKITALIQQEQVMENIRQQAMNWSRTYTLELFQSEIKKLVKL